jgi:signal transduction histidine kinase
MFTEVTTERKRAEEVHRQLVAQARVAEALREVDRRKDEFLAMLSHELRNPLAPIAMAIEIMRMREPADESIVWARDVIARRPLSSRAWSTICWTSRASRWARSP